MDQTGIAVQVVSAAAPKDLIRALYRVWRARLSVREEGSLRLEC